MSLVTLGMGMNSSVVTAGMGGDYWQLLESPELRRPWRIGGSTKRRRDAPEPLVQLQVRLLKVNEQFVESHNTVFARHARDHLVKIKATKRPNMRIYVVARVKR